ncbi:MAG: Cadherin-like beta sandwich domain protein [Eubacteriales bacterium]
MKKHACYFTFVFAFLCLTVIKVSANAEPVPYFTYTLDKSSVSAGDFIKVQLIANQTADTAAGFRMAIEYDAAVFSFVRTETSAQIKSGTMYTNSTGNPIRSVYVCNVDHPTAPELSGNILSFVFQVKNSAPAGKAIIGAHIDDVCNYNAKRLDVSVNQTLTAVVNPPEEEPSDEASLASLQPYQGELIPPFSPDIYKYKLYVDSHVNSVEFSASARDGGTVRINRKSLYKAGTATPIIATVTSANKKVKTEYVITVFRGEKPVPVSDGEPDKPESGTLPKGKASGQNQKAQKKENSVKTRQTKQAGKSAAAVPAEAGQDDQQAIQTAVQQPSYSNHSDRNIYVIGNQMPTFFIGMLTTVLCLMVGIFLTFYLRIAPRK